MQRCWPTPNIRTARTNRPEIGQKLAYPGHRDGGAERCADPAVHKRVAGDLALIDSYDRLLSALEWAIVKTATPHDAHTFDRLQSVPGLGKILSLVLLNEIHDLQRLPQGAGVHLSYGRLVTCAKESAGKRSGTSGTNIGRACLKGAFAEAAVLFLRENPRRQKYLARLEKKHG